jgi:colanic acid/amylovoran biosynthesis glycosyltransferase
MRVAYLINLYPTVSHTFIRREIIALEALGVDVVRFALRGWEEVPLDPANVKEQEQTSYVLMSGALRLVLATLKVSLSNFRLFSRAIRDVFLLSAKGDRPFWVCCIYLFEACWLKAELDLLEAQGKKIDHLHAHFGTNPAAIAMILRSLGGPPFSFTVHGPEEFDRPSALKLGLKASRAKNVIAISSFGRSQLYRWLSPNDWVKVEVVRCGLEASYFEPTSSLNQECSTTGEVKRSLVCVGRLNEQKGHLVLLEAARVLRNRGVLFKLIFAGDGEMRPKIDARVEEHGLQSFVSVTGWLTSDEVKCELVNAHAMVLPSFAEGLPVVIMEAMALMRPVISTYVAGIPELVINGETGWLVPAGDIDALADAIDNMLNTPAELMLQMGNAGKTRALSAHSIDKSAQLLKKIFAE